MGKRAKTSSDKHHEFSEEALADPERKTGSEYLIPSLSYPFD